MVFTHAVVGLGPSGIFTLACLPKQFLATTVVIEPAAVGGTLSSHYGSVVANIPKSEILGAFPRREERSEKYRTGLRSPCLKNTETMNAPFSQMYADRCAR